MTIAAKVTFATVEGIGVDGGLSNCPRRVQFEYRSNRRRTMGARWIAHAALVLGVLCACRPALAAGQQVTQKESSLPPKDASERVKEISTSQLKEWMTTGPKFTLIDVREDNEWQAGHAAAAIHISRWMLSERIATVVPDKSARIVLYCLGGTRSAAAAVTIQKLGYTNVFSLAGGFKNYQLAGFPIQEVMFPLSGPGFRVDLHRSLYRGSVTRSSTRPEAVPGAI